MNKKTYHTKYGDEKDAWSKWHLLGYGAETMWYQKRFYFFTNKIMIKDFLQGMHDFVYTNKRRKWIIVTRLVVVFFTVLWFADKETALTVRYWFGLIDFGTMYWILTIVFFAEEMSLWLVGKMNLITFDFEERTNTQQVNWDCIDEIYTEQLAVFLIEYWWLPTKETKEAFDINNEQLKKLWDNLERAKILKRWKSNARVLVRDDYEYIMNIMDWVVDSDDLHAPLVKVSDWTYEYA